MAFIVRAITEKGGSVDLNKAHGVWASYAVGTVGDAPPPEIFYSGITLPDGRLVQFFVNRETNLVVVDVVYPKPRGKQRIAGIEVYRATV